METPQNKENAFYKTILYIFYQSKTWSVAILKIFVKITGPYSGYFNQDPDWHLSLAQASKPKIMKVFLYALGLLSLIPSRI